MLIFIRCTPTYRHSFPFFSSFFSLFFLHIHFVFFSCSYCFVLSFSLHVIIFLRCTPTYCHSSFFPFFSRFFPLLHILFLFFFFFIVSSAFSPLSPVCSTLLLFLRISSTLPLSPGHPFLPFLLFFSLFATKFSQIFIFLRRCAATLFSFYFLPPASSFNSTCFCFALA